MNKTKPPIKDKIVFYASAATAIFLLLIYLNHTILKLDAAIVGVIMELLTVPVVLAQPVLVIMAGMGFDLNHYQIKSYPFFSILISLPTLLLLMYSFS